MAQGKHVKREMLTIDGIQHNAKECTKCNEMKILDDFGNTKGTSDKKVSMCKACNRIVSSEYRKKPSSKEVAKKYRSENRERYNRSNRKYYRNNTEAAAAKTARWAKENPDRHKITYTATQNRRRAMKRSLITEYDSSDSRFVQLLYSGCILTGETDNLHEDHFIALSTGHCGTYQANMVPLRADLNISKRANNPFEWMSGIQEPIDVERFLKSLLILAHLNGITLVQYINFVNWCYENPRTSDEVTDENRDSLNYWMRMNGNKYLFETEVS